MITTSTMVVGCGFDMVARNADKGFITDKECPEGHPQGLPVMDLLDSFKRGHSSIQFS